MIKIVIYDYLEATKFSIVMLRLRARRIGSDGYEGPVTLPFYVGRRTRPPARLARNGSAGMARSDMVVNSMGQSAEPMMKPVQIPMIIPPTIVHTNFPSEANTRAFMSFAGTTNA
jgi:hypothetical protein